MFVEYVQFFITIVDEINSLGFFDFSILWNNSKKKVIIYKNLKKKLKMEKNLFRRRRLRRESRGRGRPWVRPAAVSRARSSAVVVREITESRSPAAPLAAARLLRRGSPGRRLAALPAPPRGNRLRWPTAARLSTQRFSEDFRPPRGSFREGRQPRSRRGKFGLSLGP